MLSWSGLGQSQLQKTGNAVRCILLHAESNKVMDAGEAGEADLRARSALIVMATSHPANGDHTTKPRGVLCGWGTI